jgi:ribosomal protein S18 acetylase RimI-like enzyme
MTDPDIRVEEATAVSGELVSTLRELVSQLSSASAPSEQELEAIVSSPATRLLVARDSGGAVIGTLTLVLFRIPTGMRAWIEDVVVDEAARGRGTGEHLIRAALALAEANGARTVDLTSRPSREAANRLYEKLGFELRETNVYRFRSPAPPP